MTGARSAMMDESGGRTLPVLWPLVPVVVLDYAAQVPYYLILDLAPHHTPPSPSAILLLTATLAWFTAGHVLLVARKSRTGWWLLWTFLVANGLFYLGTLLSGAVAFQLRNSNPVVVAVFIYGYITGAVCTAYAVILIRHRRQLTAHSTPATPIDAGVREPGLPLQPRDVHDRQAVTTSDPGPTNSRNPRSEPYAAHTHGRRHDSARGRGREAAELGWARAHPLTAFTAAVYGISAIAAVVVYAPLLMPGPRSPYGTLWRSLAMFPAMVIVVGVAGVLLTAATAGRAARTALWARLHPRLVPWRWWLLVALPPAAILAVLAVGRTTSPAFVPGLNPYGLGFGLLAGFCEELGWTGYAWPRMRPRFPPPFAAAAVLGVAWGCWHLPVLDHLAALPPDAAWFPAFAAAFIIAMTALRILICWAYSHTGSILLAQATHASSTTFLVFLSPLAATQPQEVGWYGGYALALWATVAAAVGVSHSSAARRRVARAVPRLFFGSRM